MDLGSMPDSGASIGPWTHLLFRSTEKGGKLYRFCR